MMMFLFLIANLNIYEQVVFFVIQTHKLTGRGDFRTVSRIISKEHVQNYSKYRESLKICFINSSAQNRNLHKASANFSGWKQIVGLKILRSIYDKLKLLFLVKKL